MLLKFCILPRVQLSILLQEGIIVYVVGKNSHEEYRLIAFTIHLPGITINIICSVAPEPSGEISITLK